MTVRTKASERGGVLGPAGIIDVDALSKRSRLKVRTGNTGDFTQNSTVKTPLGPMGVPGRLIGALLSFTTVPAGGTLTAQIVAYDASENAEVVLTDALDAETVTTREGLAFVLASTNVALDADDTLEVHTIASNNAVGTQQVGGRVTLLIDPTEETTIDQ